MKILIVGPSWVGDMVMAQSLFIALQNNHSSCEIHVLAPPWCKDLLDHMPEVSRAIEMTVGHGELGLGKRRALGKQLKQEKYDQAIVLPNSFKSALIPWFAAIPLRTGWRGEARSWLLNDCRVLDKKAYPLMVERFIALASAAGAALPDPLPYPSLKAGKSSMASLFDRLGIGNSDSVLVLCPGAEFGEAKKWPAESYAEVASQWLNCHLPLHLQQQQGQVWILGSAADNPDAQKIIQCVPQANQEDCIDLTGKTSLADAIDLMSCADQVISNDSGLMHIAAALARPLVVVYGSTSPAFTPPLTSNVKIVSLGLDCSPCFKRVCPLGHTHCLKNLKAELVSESLQQLVSP